MKFDRPGPTYLTTTEAGQLIDRSPSAIRNAICSGHLPSVRRDGFQWVDRYDVLGWDLEAIRRRTRHRPPEERLIPLLAEHGTMDSRELAILLDLHVGNVRKYLAILAHQGRARRRPDGQWELTANHAGVA